MTESASDQPRGWTFLTNHAHVLLALARDPDARLRDVAATVGVTERAAQAIVSDLEAGGYLSRTRVGRRNHYTINPSGRFRHPNESDHEIGDLLALFSATAPPLRKPHRGTPFRPDPRAARVDP